MTPSRRSGCARSSKTPASRCLFTSLPWVVLGDRRRITQVLLNLVGNAVKFTTDGTVHLRVGPANRAIEFTVRDTGCGIAPDDLETIFDPYIRAPRGHHTETEGSGLGLAIAHRLVKAMNGTLTAQSRPQIGSTFTMELDLPAASPSPDSWSGDRQAPGPSLSGVRVLLAEDNSVSQMVLQRHLKMLGGQVEVVDTGPEALARVLESSFDVVILDFHMPGLSGLEVSRQLRRAGYDIPIIGLTASALPEDEALRGPPTWMPTPPSRSAAHNCRSSSTARSKPAARRALRSIHTARADPSSGPAHRHG